MGSLSEIGALGGIEVLRGIEMRQLRERLRKFETQHSDAATVTREDER